MERLPKVITTSVIRSSRHGESHGGVYLVDLQSGDFEQVIDWNEPSINWEGRGGDRGLRGIAFHAENVYIAASDEVFVYNSEFELLDSYRNKYLKQCHEICIARDTLYLTSTKLNSVLEFDLATHRFTRGHHLIYRNRSVWLRSLLSFFRLPSLLTFDPNADMALPAKVSDELHINNVAAQPDGILIAGTQLDALLSLQAMSLRKYAPLPLGTHNATAYKDGIIYNDTRSNRIVIASRANHIRRSFAVPEFPDLPMSSPGDYARQGFGRGLCTFGSNYIIAGSSPSTISVYDASSGERVQMVRLSKDIRNCIHGLELWPETW